MTAVESVETTSVLVERRDRVLIITLNRPGKRNAVDLAVAEAVEAATDRLESDPTLSAGVIAGNGPVFCAGMDLKAFARGESPRTARRGFCGLAELPPTKPLIAAVDGPALGGGFEVVLACDLVVISESASFAMPEVKRGLIASSGGLLRLPHRIPYNRAMELALTGATLGPHEALALGLANRLTPPGQAAAVAVELAAQVAAGGPLAVAATKRVIQESSDWPSDEAFARLQPIAEPIRRSNDAREGALAFAEKRAPQWTGT
jgi:enoyl-CoA hydratase